MKEKLLMQEKGAPLQNCLGFIDMTLWPVFTPPSKNLIQIFINIFTQLNFGSMPTKIGLSVIYMGCLKFEDMLLGCSLKQI